MSGYWFCVDCNRRTGKWDEIYIGLHRELLKLLHFGPELPRERMMGRLNIDIGAFARAMWAWSFALVPTLRDDYPHVAEAVRTGASVDPPVGIDLLLGVTMSLHIWAVGQPAAVKASISAAGAVKRPSGLVVPGTQMEPLPITVVSSPPFNVVLAHAERPRGVPHSVVSGWLHDPAGVRRDVEVDLPMVDIAGDSTVGPMVVDYSLLARAPSPGSDGR